MPHHKLKLNEIMSTVFGWTVFGWKVFGWTVFGWTVFGWTVFGWLGIIETLKLNKTFSSLVQSVA